jgi:hypothetical protein
MTVLVNRCGLPRWNRFCSRLFRTLLQVGLVALAAACARRGLCDASGSLAEAGEQLFTSTGFQMVTAKGIRPTAPRRTTFVRAGSSFQEALDSAKPGDLLVLQSGATFTGPFVLPKKSGSGWIVIQSSAIDRLPMAGTRVSPSNSKFMPVLESAAGSVLATESCASHYWFIGIEIRPAAGVFLYNLVQLGNDERSLNELPHDIVFERCYIHGDPTLGGRRGIAMNSRATIVKDSYFADFKEVGADSQAILSWNGAGPFSIVNNDLQAAGENVMFGSADPTIQGLIPSDIEIRRNHFFKPLSWKMDDPSYAGTPWTVKNLFELKNARRVLIDGNLFEYNWPQAQNGFAILFTVRNQYGGAPWSRIEDVTFTNNIVRHVGSAVNILGFDNNHPSGQTRRVQIRNNLFTDIGGAWGPGRLFQLLEGTADVAIEHNTAFHAENFLYADGHTPHTGFIFRNNIVEQRQYGLIGSGSAPGLASLKQYFPGAVMAGNAIVGANSDLYPPDNSFPKSLVGVGFIDVAAENYRLTKSSDLHQAGTDGRDVGVDFEALASAQRSSASPQIQHENQRTVSGLRAAVTRK